MPIRTVMNYQYRYGTTMTAATRTLYADGGWTRYYQGLTAALIQGPVSRFGDTAANAGILALLESNSFMKKLPALVKTVFASLAAAAFRMILTPVDTVKTTMQTDGKRGLVILRQRVCLFKLAIGNYSLFSFCRLSPTALDHYGMVHLRQPRRRLSDTTHGLERTITFKKPCRNHITWSRNSFAKHSLASVLPSCLTLCQTRSAW